MAQGLADAIAQSNDFELLAPVPLSLVCFRYHPPGVDGQAQLDNLNAMLMEQLNRSGKMYLSHTKLRGQFVLRMAIAQTNVQQHHVDEAWALIQNTARALMQQTARSLEGA
jgi:aromatic-L-amino-acid decarboxylase